MRTHRPQFHQLLWGLQLAQRLVHDQGLWLPRGFPGSCLRGLPRQALRPQGQVPHRGHLQGLLPHLEWLPWGLKQEPG